MQAISMTLGKPRRTDRKRIVIKAPIDRCETHNFRINGMWASIRTWQVGDWESIPVKQRPRDAMFSESLKTVAVFAAYGKSQAEAMEAARLALIAADPEAYRKEMMKQAAEALATYDERINAADRVSPVSPDESDHVWDEG